MGPFSLRVPVRRIAGIMREIGRFWRVSAGPLDQWVPVPGKNPVLLWRVVTHGGDRIMNLRYLNYAIEALFTPVGLTLVSLLVIVVICSFFTRRVALWLCVLLFAVSAFSTSRYVVLWTPLQQIAENARYLVVLMLVGTVLTLLSHIKFPSLSFGIVGWVFYMVCLASDMILAGVYEKGFVNLLAAVMMFLVFGIGINSFLDSPNMAKKVLNIHILALLAILICCQIQLTIDRSAIAPGRLFGISGNPQGFGWILATGLIGILARWFITPFRNVPFKIFSAGMGLYVLILLLWTGSRMSWLTAVVGVLMFFRRRLGALLFAFIPILVLVLGYILIVPEAGGGGGVTAESDSDTISSVAQVARGRFTAMDTRSGVILRLWNEFAVSPVVGQVHYMAWGENSYLSVAASMGLIGVCVMGLAFMGGVVDLLKVHARRGLLCREDQVIFDYVVGCLAGMAVAGMLDGIMLAFTPFWGIFPIYVLMLLNYLVRQSRKTEISEQLMGLGTEQEVYRAAENAFGGVRGR